MTRRHLARRTLFGVIEWSAFGVPCDYGTGGTICSRFLSWQPVPEHYCTNNAQPRPHLRAPVANILC